MRQSMPSRSKPIRIERRCSTPARAMRSSERVTAARPMSEPTSMWSGPIAMRRAAERRRPWTIMVLVPMPSILAPSATRKCARSCTCGSDAALRRIVVPSAATAATSAFSVAVTLGSSRKTSAPFSFVARNSSRCVGRDGRAELLEREKMRVEAPPPDDVAARRRQRDLAAARQQRPGEQDRGADPRAQLGIEIGGADFPGVDRERVARLPFGRRADRADQLHQRLGVADARNVFERDRLLGEQRRGDDRQRGVLVAGGLDGAGKPVAAFDDVLDGRHASLLLCGYRYASVAGFEGRLFLDRGDLFQLADGTEPVPRHLPGDDAAKPKLLGDGHAGRLQAISNGVEFAAMRFGDRHQDAYTRLRCICFGSDLSRRHGIDPIDPGCAIATDGITAAPRQGRKSPLFSGLHQAGADIDCRLRQRAGARRQQSPDFRRGQIGKLLPQQRQYPAHMGRCHTGAIDGVMARRPLSKERWLRRGRRLGTARNRLGRPVQRCR